MDKYEVTIRDITGTLLDPEWTMVWMADDFGHAEEQTLDMLKSTKVDGYSTIIAITKEYD